MNAKSNVVPLRQKAERESEKKWGRAVMDLGYSMVPSLIRKGKQICLQILEALPSARMFCRQISPHAQESKFVYTEHWQENLSVRSFRSSPVGVSC